MADDLTGSSAAGFTLRRQIGEGAFGVIYEGVHSPTGERKAFKVARRQAARRPEETEANWSTLALGDMTGHISRLKLDPSLVLRLQFETLRRVGPPIYPKTDGLLELEGRAAIQMELVEGPSLSDLMGADAVPSNLPLALAGILARLERQGVPHGDLKPANILWMDGRVVLLDPGYFGELPAPYNLPGPVTITTPAYYPLRIPDDMMAFGLILVELASGTNPLRMGGEMEKGLVSRDLRKRVSGLHLANNYFFDSICGLSTRTAIGESLAMSPLAAIVEQCLGVKLGNHLREGPKYASFSALEADLQNLAATSPSLPAAPIRCFDCDQPVSGGTACSHCGASRVAPPCPHCGKPVSRALNQSIPNGGFADWTGIRDRCAWNAGWDRRCGGCGMEFSAKVKVATGHAAFPDGPADPEFDAESARLSGQSMVRIDAGESVYMRFDFWDHQPVVSVHVKRAADTRSEGTLSKEATIAMTVEEWRTILDKLNGPLRPLLQRRAWSRDTT